MRPVEILDTIAHAAGYADLSNLHIDPHTSKQPLGQRVRIAIFFTFIVKEHDIVTVTADLLGSE